MSQSKGCPSDANFFPLPGGKGVWSDDASLIATLDSPDASGRIGGDGRPDESGFSTLLGTARPGERRSHDTRGNKGGI